MPDAVENSGSQATLPRICASCGAVVGGEKCWLCGSTSTLSGAPAPRPALVTSAAPGSPTFGLSSLFLFITLVSVCFGVLVVAPGLGILLAIFAVPAFVRASASAARERTVGKPTELGDKMRLFLSSLGVLILIGLAGCAAFFAACWVACEVAGIGERGLPAVFLLGGCAALLLVGWLLWITWPRQGSRR